MHPCAWRQVCFFGPVQGHLLPWDHNDTPRPEHRMRMSDQIQHRRDSLLVGYRRSRCNTKRGPPAVLLLRTSFPYSSPCLCRSRRDSIGSSRQLQQIYGVCGEARGVDIAYLGMQASIDSPVFHFINTQSNISRVSFEPTAAPPAIVPNRQLLISMTFLTVWLAIQSPAVALESVATMMPPWNRNARVVVPCASLIGQLGFAWSSVVARRKAEGFTSVSAVVHIDLL